MNTTETAIAYHTAKNANAVRVFTFKHTIDKSNLRFSHYAEPAICEATVTIRGSEIEVGHICFPMELAYLIKSWITLEYDIEEEAKALYL